MIVRACGAIGQSSRRTILRNSGAKFPPSATTIILVSTSTPSSALGVWREIRQGRLYRQRTYMASSGTADQMEKPKVYKTGFDSWSLLEA